MPVSGIARELRGCSQEPAQDQTCLRNVQGVNSADLRVKQSLLCRTHRGLREPDVPPLLGDALCGAGPGEEPTWMAGSPGMVAGRRKGPRAQTMFS